RSARSSKRRPWPTSPPWWRRTARGGRAPAAPPLVPGPGAGEAPLSFAQERLWFLCRLEPGSAAYNLPAALRLGGPLDVAALDAAVAAVRERHAALRTRFGVAGGVPLQRIGSAPAPALALIDLSALPPRRARGEAERLTAALVRRPFDLAGGPSLRLALV